MKESFREREKERLDGQHEISDMLYYTTKEHRTYLASTVIGNSCFTMSRLEWPAINTYQLYILNNRLKSSMNYIYVMIASWRHRLGNQFINHTTFLVSVILISPLLVLNTLLGIQWQHMGHFIHVLQVIQMCFFVCVLVYVCAIHIICNAKAPVFMCVWCIFIMNIFSVVYFHKPTVWDVQGVHLE